MKLPRDVSGKKTIRVLMKLGFKQTNQVGSHVKMTKDGTSIIVYTHSFLKPSALHRILKQANVTVEEFKQLL
jgi:predicted RNA binding protein YcfA (HicA-like mRNA interferase family)